MEQQIFYGILEAAPSRDGGHWLIQGSRDQALMVLTLLEVFSLVNVQGVWLAAAAVFILWAGRGAAETVMRRKRGSCRARVGVVG